MRVGDDHYPDSEFPTPHRESEQRAWEFRRVRGRVGSREFSDRLCPVVTGDCSHDFEVDPFGEIHSTLAWTRDPEEMRKESSDREET